MRRFSIFEDTASFNFQPMFRNIDPEFFDFLPADRTSRLGDGSELELVDVMPRCGPLASRPDSLLDAALRSCTSNNIPGRKMLCSACWRRIEFGPVVLHFRLSLRESSEPPLNWCTNLRLLFEYHELVQRRRDRLPGSLAAAMLQLALHYAPETVRCFGSFTRIVSLFTPLELEELAVPGSSAMEPEDRVRWESHKGNVLLLDSIAEMCKPPA
jgi:hypothetical protein